MRNLLLTMFLLLSSHSAYACYDSGRSDKANFDNCMAQAQQGNAFVQSNLGILYENGRGVTQDYKQAVKWYRKAAEQGIAQAQYNLGNMYYDGRGITQHYVSAHMWWNIAASSGHKSATTNRDLVAKEMSPSQIEKAQDMAREWTVKNQLSQNMGNPKPQRTLKLDLLKLYDDANKNYTGLKNYLKEF